jgi:hypothetical protein
MPYYILSDQLHNWDDIAIEVKRLIYDKVMNIISNNVINIEKNIIISRVTSVIKFVEKKRFRKTTSKI